jgi:hypothetical protein
MKLKEQGSSHSLQELPYFPGHKVHYDPAKYHTKILRILQSESDF